MTRAAPPTNDERELLLGYLQRQRELVVATTESLTDDELQWTPPGALLPIGGIVNHLAHVEWRWINGRYRREPFPARGEEFVGGREVLDTYAARGRETDAIVRAAPDLGAPCLGCEGEGPPAHVLLGLDAPVDLRWVLLHLIEETAHHAGHADATREMLDGKRMTG